MITIRKKNNFQTTEQINIAPLIDMVFILLIFFILTSTFTKETGIEINKPVAKSVKKLTKENIFITVNKNGAVYYNNKQIDIYSIRSIIKRAIKNSPNTDVLIISDKDTKTGLIVSIIDQCKIAGAKNIFISANKNEE
ncbi:MAG TPA: biopolymer transporter ExbD [bacterium]|nr:biopolymer transporter ExbD [bacterium]HOL48416.1 biopolymer transporter ExbD [bacterium]HPQ19461.1 biopolymer transporter ExbD [bacterium]